MHDCCDRSAGGAPAGEGPDQFPSLTEGELLRFSKIVGCDRLSVSFPIDAHNPDPTDWNSSTTIGPGTPNESENWGGSVKVNKVPVFVGASFIGAVAKWFGKVEFNPSRVLDPDGWAVVSVPEAVEVLGEVVDEAARRMLSPAVPSIDQMKVKRVDLTRDFEVDRGEFYLRGLGSVPRPWARQNFTHHDPKRGNAQTLMVGSGAGYVRLYDKCAETDGRAPAGTLRWELEGKSAWASNYGGVKTVADLRQGIRVGQLAENRWRWSGMGVEVAARSRMVEKVKRSGLSPAKQRGFIGWLTMMAEGEESPLGSQAAAEYRKLARTLGVTLGPDKLDESTGGFVGRLDFDSGREVLRAS